VSITTFNQTITENLGFIGRRKSTGKGLIKALVRKSTKNHNWMWQTMLARTKTFQLTRNARQEVARQEVHDRKCKAGSARQKVQDGKCKTE
jgi:hypothetical protein